MAPLVTLRAYPARRRKRAKLAVAHLLHEAFGEVACPLSGIELVPQRRGKLLALAQLSLTAGPVLRLDGPQAPPASAWRLEESCPQCYGVLTVGDGLGECRDCPHSTWREPLRLTFKPPARDRAEELANKIEPLFGTDVNPLAAALEAHCLALFILELSHWGAEPRRAFREACHDSAH